MYIVWIVAVIGFLLVTFLYRGARKQPVKLDQGNAVMSAQAYEMLRAASAVGVLALLAIVFLVSATLLYGFLAGIGGR